MKQGLRIMKNKTLLLIIDAQNDFFDIPESVLKYRPTLPVPGSWADAQRLSDFIKSEKFNIDSIFATFDTHSEYDISHCSYWIDSETGENPLPFTEITVESFISGKYTTSDPALKEHAQMYLQSLKDNGKPNHFIFPNHCIPGTEGYEIVAPVAEALAEWSQAKENKSIERFNKGENPNYEFFGPFESQVVVEHDDETKLKVDVIKNMVDNFDSILVSGQALSHCVGTGLKQIIDCIESNYSEDAAKSHISKISLLANTTSPVGGFEQVGTEIIEFLKHKGVQITDV